MAPALTDRAQEIKMLALPDNLAPWPIPVYPSNPPPGMARPFDYDDAEEDKHEPDADPVDEEDIGICPTCNGSGEGMFDGSTCSACGGWGER